MANKIYGFIGIDGGSTGFLDAIPGADLNNNDIAIGVSSGKLYSYLLDDDSGAAQSVPDIIAPNTGAGAGKVLTSDANGVASWSAAGAGMTYPGAGIALSNGSAWSASIKQDYIKHYPDKRSIHSLPENQEEANEHTNPSNN
jgi:hypothetical protein